VTETVVDVLEAVDVHAQRSHRRVATARAGEQLVRPADDQRSVRQRRRLIVRRLIAQLTL
jgi:hypothetical protein